MHFVTALLLLLLLPCTLGELLSASVLFRHGDRSPLHTYPADPNPKSVWPDGLGQLTPRGARQLQDLGRFLRARYGSLLSAAALQIRSTHTDRTIASARNCIAGLLDKKPDNVSVTSPVTIVSPPRSEDNLLSVDKHCQKMRAISKAISASSEVTSQIAPYQDLLGWLHKRAGFSGTMTLHHFNAVRDVMFCSRAHNLPQPRWMTPAAWKRMLLLKDLLWRLAYSKLAQRRHKGGPLLNRILTDFRADAKTGKGRLRLYSAHDSNVAALLASAHILNGRQPPYASAVLVELHSVHSVQSVQFLFRNNSALLPFNLTVPGCALRCPLSKLFKLLRAEMLPEMDVEKSCALPKVRKRSFFGFFFFLTVGLCAAVVAGLFLLMRRSRTPARYARLPTQEENAL